MDALRIPTQPTTTCQGLRIHTSADPCRMSACWQIIDPDDDEVVGVACDYHLGVVFSNGGWCRPMLVAPLDFDDDDDGDAGVGS